MVVAPINAFLHWLLVWHFEMGFIGAPIAVAIVENLLPLGLFLYVYFVAGREVKITISPPFRLSTPI